MKIAIFSDIFYPELSGISDSIITTACSLANRGHKINFFVPKYSQKNYSYSNIPQKEPNLGENIKITRFSSFSYPGPSNQSRFVMPLGIRYFSVKNFDPDIIHSHLFFGVGIEALISAKILNIPLIGTNHTATSEFVRYFPVARKWISGKALAYSVWYYNRCDFVTAPSKSVFNEMVSLGFNKPYEIISNPVDTDLFSPAGKEGKKFLRNKFNLKGPVIFYAGRLAEEKNVDTVIKAFAGVLREIPNAEFVLAGRGKSELALKELAENMNVAKNTKFLGTLNKNELSQFYKASDIFVNMSTSETQSLTLMQAMSSGLPVVGANARALPEYIKENTGFLVEPGNHTELAKKLIYLIKNDKLINDLGAEARKFAGKFSINSISKKWEDLYGRFAAINKKSHL